MVCPVVAAKTGVVTPAPTPGIDWSGCNLTGADLASADLAGASLTGANLLGANLTSANFTNANLTSANLGGAVLSSAIFTGATFTGVTSGSIFTADNVTLPVNWLLYDGYLMGPKANLAGISMVRLGMDFPNADLDGANLTGAAFDQSELYQTNLTDANLTGASFFNSTLSGVTITGANFTNADLTGLFAYGTVGTAGQLPPNWSQSGSYLLGPTTNLTRADLSNMDLTGVDLRGAQLGEASLNDANLSHANLYGAGLDGANILGATWDDTTCPDNTNSDADNSTCENDLTAVPVATPTFFGSLGNNGWYTGPVTVTWNWSDLNGGINPGACPATSTSSGNGPAVVVTAKCPNSLGKVGTESVTFKVDAVPPHVVVTGVQQNRLYALGRVPRCVAVLPRTPSPGSPRRPPSRSPRPLEVRPAPEPLPAAAAPAKLASPPGRCR